MDANSLFGVWTGNVQNDSGWDMKMTLSVLQPVKADTMLGVFDIPFMPCAGTFHVLAVNADTIELQAEKLQGDCVEADSHTLELLSDGTLLYTSKGKDWETRCILERALEE